jgi:hypothetical protein
VVDASTRNITLDLNGCTLQQAGVVSVIQAKGLQTTAKTVELGLDGSGNTRISYDKLPAEIKVGIFVKLVSDDALPGDKIVGPAPTLMGQHLEVASTDGNTVTFKGALIDQAVYQTNMAATIPSPILTPTAALPPI